MATKRVRFPKELDDADEIPNSRALKKRRVDEVDTDTTSVSVNLDYEKKHTLDSDEEDETEKYERFDAEKFEGQEDATQEYDGRTKIMAFNMKEDMEEGHFDKNGTFIFNKKEDIIKDAWLDNVNWDNVKNSAGKLWQKESETNEAELDESEERSSTDVESVYKRLITLLATKSETVDAALKRLNAEKGLSAAEERKQRWAAKKAGIPFETDNSKKVAELTSLADNLISLGHMRAYQLDTNQIESLLHKIDKPKDEPASTSSNNSEPFDIFGDQPPAEAAYSSTEVKPSDADAKDSQTAPLWEFRVKDKEGKLDDALHGPYLSNKMEELKASKLLKFGGMVRKVGTQTFYDIKRIDFDLYD